MEDKLRRVGRYIFALALLYLAGRTYVNRRFAPLLLLPSPPSFPVLGHVPYLAPDPGEERKKLAEQRFYKWMVSFPRIMLLWLGPVTPVVSVHHPETIRQVLSIPSAKATLYDFVRPWLGDGLLLSFGDKWKTRRRLLTPGFHFEILRDFSDVFQAQTEVLLTALDAHAAKGKSFDIFPVITKCVLEIICLTAMGKGVGAQVEEDNDYIRAVHAASQRTWDRIITPWYWPDNLYYYFFPAGRDYRSALTTLHTFTRDVIRERRREYQEKGPKRDGTKAFLDILMDAEPPLSESDLQEEVDTFMFEGHDTTSSGITWTLFCLAANPACLRRAQEEVDRVLGAEGAGVGVGGRRTPTYDEAKGQLEYTGRCIKEAMRMFPPVPFFARRIEEDLEVDGYVIPADTTVAIAPLLAHYNPTSWPNAEVYNPDRFDPADESSKRHPYAYIPFSAGPRNCIGQVFADLEEKIVVASIIHRFDLAVEPRYHPRPRPELILRPHKGMFLTLKTRNPSSSSTKA